MTKIDWAKERARLETLYAAMNEGELQEAASDADSLTDVARAALRAEMLRRGMNAPPETRPVAEPMRISHEPPKPVMVGRYRDLSTALLAKSVLESAGIESFLADDSVIRLDWLISNALGGIKLLVRDDDASAARELLETSVPEKFEVEGAGEYEQPRCPKCGSHEVSLNELDKKIAFPSLLLGIPIPAVRHGWNCRTCGHTWEPEAESAAE